MPDLAIIVPTRGRPENIRKVIAAWDFTNAWDDADLILVADADDPEIRGYRSTVVSSDHRRSLSAGDILLVERPTWVPMVHKLDTVASALAEEGRYFALGFAGDDHLPQTIGWAARYLTVLRELGTGMVYGDDGYQGVKLATEWAVTADAVRALGRMVPAPVEHMYCDNSMMDLFGGAGAMRHLPEIRIEHMHPYAGKAETDAQYDRVNHRDQFRKDRTAYEKWQHNDMAADVVVIRDLRKGRLDVTSPEPKPARPRVAGSAPRRLMRRQRSAPTAARLPRTERVPRHFRNVRAATPEDIMITLADFASQVPDDQEIVELGVFCGRTALQLAWGASLGNGAHVTAIDPWDLPGNVYDPPFTDEESKRWAQHWVRSLGYDDKIDLIQAFSQDVADRWSSGVGEWSVRPVGLLFVDGDHTKEGAKRDIVSWAPHLADGAIIAVDDYGHPDWPGVGEAVDELVAEGFLDPIEMFHDRLAVTRLTVSQGYKELFQREAPIRITAVTSEGVSPSPYPAVDGQVAVSPVQAMIDRDHEQLGGHGEQPDRAALEAEWRDVDPDGVAALERSAAQVIQRVTVQAGELAGVELGTGIGDLNLINLKALAKHRGIVLGARKDKRDLILQALRDGK